MKNDELVRAYEAVAPDEEAKARMLNAILQADTSAAPKRKAPAKLIRFAAAAACAAAIAAIAVIPQRTAAPIAPPAPQAEQSAPRPPVTEAPAMRRFFNYEGRRYAVSGPEFPKKLQVREEDAPLGVIRLDILADPENRALDLAGTFAVGGELLPLQGCDPTFRVALRWNGADYLGEYVGNTDGTPPDIPAYFAASGLTEKAESLRIYDHSGAQARGSLEQGRAQELLSRLAEAVPAKLSDEQYLQIGQAQQNGGSFLLEVLLRDEPPVQIYLIPSLSLTMIGDSRCTLPEGFSAEFGPFFDSLTPEN